MGTLLDDVQALMDKYLAWLKSKTVLKQVNEEWVEVETPHLDRHNDYLSIYIRRHNDQFELTDGGYILNDLRMSGCPIERGQRAQFLEQTLRAFGVERQEDALVTYASAGTFPIRKHSLLQAMLTVDDLFFTASAHVEKLFVEDVRDWLDDNEVRYSERIKIGGRTGFDQMFNFLIPKSKKFPERFVQAVNTPQKDSVSDIVFRWEDIKGERSDARLYVVLNDQTGPLPDGVITALRNYSLIPVIWRNMNQFREELAA